MTPPRTVARGIPDTDASPTAMRKRCTRPVSRIVPIAALLLLNGCGADTAVPTGSPGGSLFAARNIRVQAMLKKEDGTPGPVMIEIHGSPVSIVYPLLEQAHTRHREDADKITMRVEELQDALSREQTRLKEIQVAVSGEYNDMLPEPSDAMSRTSRDSLQHLSKARAHKTRADDWLRKTHADRIAPVEGLIRSLESQTAAMKLNLAAHHADRPNVLFAALPDTPHTWKTSKDGEEKISIPPGEPWCFWATYRLGRLRVRWLQASDDADANGKLSFDETNTLDGALALPSSLNSVLRPD